jgi:hypothetical protein
MKGNKLLKSLGWGKPSVIEVFIILLLFFIVMLFSAQPLSGQEQKQEQGQGQKKPFNILDYTRVELVYDRELDYNYDFDRIIPFPKEMGDRFSREVVIIKYPNLVAVAINYITQTVSIYLPPGSTWTPPLNDYDRFVTLVCNTCCYPDNDGNLQVKNLIF